MRTRPLEQLSASRFARRLLHDQRGTTMTEYALMLFLVLVVAGGGWKLLGGKLQSSMNKTTANLETSDTTLHAGGGGGGAAGGAGAAAGGGGAGGGTAAGTNEGFGGPRVPAKESEGSSLPKLAMIVLGIVGGLAAFFAMMKGKNAR